MLLLEKDPANRFPSAEDLARTVDALNGEDASGRQGILLGRDLAGKLGVKVGDSVTLLTPQGTLSPMGMMPRARRLRA